MSLDYSLANVASNDFVKDAEIIRSMSFHMMFTGVRKITTIVEAETFFNRYLQRQLVRGYSISDTFITFEVVMAFMGFETNASSMTDAAFKKQMLRELQDTSWSSFESARIEARKGVSPKEAGE